MGLYRMELDDEFGEPYYVEVNPDFEKVAEAYVNSAEAQHGDQQLAQWEAMEWWQLFLRTVG